MEQASNTIVQIKKAWKALIAFLTPFILLLTFVAGNSEITESIPAVTEWLIVVGIPALTGLLAWLKRNEPTIDEAQKALDRAKRRGI